MSVLTCGKCADYPCDDGLHLRSDKACSRFVKLQPRKIEADVLDSEDKLMCTLVFNKYKNAIDFCIEYESNGTILKTDVVELTDLKFDKNEEERTKNKILGAVYKIYPDIGIDNLKWYMSATWIELKTQNLFSKDQYNTCPVKEETVIAKSQYYELVEVTKSGKVSLIPELTADHIRNQFHVISFADTLYVYTDGYYQEGSEAIKALIVKIVRETNAIVSIREITRDILHYLKYHNPLKEYPFNNTFGLVPFKNGVVKLNFEENRLEFLDHNPKYRFNYIIPHNFDPENKGEVIHERMICKYVDDEADRNTLYQVPAQALLQAMGTASYKKMYLFLGERNAGKSTTLDLYEMSVGRSNVSGESLQSLGENRFAKASLEGKLLNCCDDLSEVPLKDVGVVKALTGKHDHQIEKKGQQSYMANIFAVHVYTCNAPPMFDSKIKKDRAFWERWECVHFRHNFPSDPKFYEEVFTPENISGFLHRVLLTCLDIRRNGLKSNSTADEVREKWSYNADPVYQYLDELFVKSTSNYYVKKEELLDKITKWAIHKDHDLEKIPQTVKGLTMRLETFDVVTARKTILELNEKSGKEEEKRDELYLIRGDVSKTILPDETEFIPKKTKVKTEQGGFN